MKGVLLCLVRRTPCAGTIHFWPVLAALVSPVQNIIFLGTYFLILLVPSAQQPGQAGVLGRLSLCLWSELIEESGRG
jgi:hypothetical protein